MKMQISEGACAGHTRPTPDPNVSEKAHRRIEPLRRDSRIDLAPALVAVKRRECLRENRRPRAVRRVDGQLNPFWFALRLLSA
jgi:hypothetical protein